MNNTNINNFNTIEIDGNKFYWDINNECLIPYDIIDVESIIINNNKENTIDSDNINDNNWEWYMENYNIEFWESILGRKLYIDERKLIHKIWNENLLNLDIKMLQKSIIQNNCYIKSITTNVGNCLFESLGSLGLGDNDLNIAPNKMIRQNLASLLLIVKTEVGFFPNLPNLTPEEIFLNQNEIHFVKDINTNQVYMYDYDMMIYDLNSNYSWERLPMEFLLMTISRIYQVEILIYHNKTKYINKINVWDKIPNNHNILNDEVEKIRLGQINEEHYFPLVELPIELRDNYDVIDQILKTEIKYDKYIHKFKKWSKNIMDGIGIGINFTNTNTNTNTNNDNDKYSIDYDISNTNNKQENYDSKIMKTHKSLTKEQINDYNEISNFDDFNFL